VRLLLVRLLLQLAIATAPAGFLGLVEKHLQSLQPAVVQVSYKAAAAAAAVASLVC
jgi:hypothetical protein